MIEKSSLSEKHIIDCLKINYGIEVTTLSLLPLGEDMDASVYKAETHNKLSYFIKVKRGHPQDISAIILDLLENAGIKEIIPIIKTIHGQASQHINGATLTVFPFIEGQDGFSRDLTDDHWYTLGKVMRQIHEINVPVEVQTKIRRESYSSKWRELVRALYPLIESEPRGDRVAINLLTFMKKHMPIIHRLVDRAEELAQMAQDQSFQFVLCHSDLHGGNILIGKDNAPYPKCFKKPGRRLRIEERSVYEIHEHRRSRKTTNPEFETGRVYIVDWDAPILAPKERDLMFIGGGVANLWNKPHEKELFYKGYGKVEVNMTLLVYYRHERIVEDIAIYGQQLLLTMEGGQDRANWYEQFIAQFDPNGVVEIAFKTDKELGG